MPLSCGTISHPWPVTARAVEVGEKIRSDKISECNSAIVGRGVDQWENILKIKNQKKKAVTMIAGLK